MVVVNARELFLILASFSWIWRWYFEFPNLMVDFGGYNTPMKANLPCTAVVVINNELQKSYAT